VRVGRVLHPGARHQDQLARPHEHKNGAPPTICRATSTGW
jgi:hypothetical protein